MTDYTLLLRPAITCRYFLCSSTLASILSRQLVKSDDKMLSLEHTEIPLQKILPAILHHSALNLQHIFPRFRHKYRELNELKYIGYIAGTKMCCMNEIKC